MKRLIVMCLALALALTPAPAAIAKTGGKSGKAKTTAKAQAKACKALSKKAKKSKKGKRAGKACTAKPKGAAKKAAAKKAAALARQQRSAAEQECRALRAEEPEIFAEDFGTSNSAFGKCVSEVLAAASEHEEGEVWEDEELPLEDEDPGVDPAGEALPEEELV